MEGNRKEIGSMDGREGTEGRGERVKLEGGKGEIRRKGSAREDKMRGLEVAYICGS